jgi:hypothetical protein
MKKLIVRLAGAGAVAAAVATLAGGVASASGGYGSGSYYSSSERSVNYSSYERNVMYGNYNNGNDCCYYWDGCNYGDMSYWY